MWREEGEVKRRIDMVKEEEEENQLGFLHQDAAVSVVLWLGPERAKRRAVSRLGSKEVSWETRC